MRALVLTAIIAAATLMSGACGGEQSSPDETRGSESPATPPTSSAGEELLTLIEVCPEVEAALPRGMMPSERRWIDFAAVIAGLSLRSDLETQNALALINRPVVRRISVQGGGLDAFDAETAILTGVSAFAKRCKQARSTALQ